MEVVFGNLKGMDKITYFVKLAATLINLFFPVGFYVGNPL